MYLDVRVYECRYTVYYMLHAASDAVPEYLKLSSNMRYSFIGECLLCLQNSNLGYCVVAGTKRPPADASLLHIIIIIIIIYTVLRVCALYKIYIYIYLMLIHIDPDRIC